MSYDHDQHTPRTPLAVLRAKLEEAEIDVQHRKDSITRMVSKHAGDMKTEEKLLARDSDLRDQLRAAVAALGGTSDVSSAETGLPDG
jgi:uncharacterized Zn finger protein